MRLPFVFLVIALTTATARADEPDRATFGAPPELGLRARAVLFVADLKRTSDVSFGDHASGDPKLRGDLGAGATQLVPGVRAELGLGPVGWVGAEYLRLDLRARGVMSEPHVWRGAFLARGDAVRARVEEQWGRLHFGHEARVHLDLDGVPLELALSPTLGVAAISARARLVRTGPEPRAGGSGRATGIALLPGLVVEARLARALRVGVEVEWLPGTRGELAVSRPAVQEWEDVLAFAAVDLGPASLLVGWRHLNTSLRRRGAFPDIKLRGLEIGLGAAF